MQDEELRQRIISDMGLTGESANRTLPELLIQHRRFVLNKEGLGLPQNKLQEQLVSVTLNKVKGDGLTDDTVAIHAVRDAAAAFGASLYFPKGTYVTTGLIANVANQSWVFDEDATLMRPSGQNIHAIQVTADDVVISGGIVDMTGDTTYASVFIGSGRSRVTVEKMYMKGGAQGVRVKGATGPVSTKITVRSNRVEGCAGHAIMFNWEVTDSDIYDNTLAPTGAGGNGVWIGNTSTGCRVLRNRITALDMGVEVGIGSTDCLVAENNINSGFYGISISGSARGLVEGNKITTTGATAHGVEIVDSPYTIGCFNTVLNVTGNGFSLPTNITGGGDYVLVYGNEIISPASQGVNGAGGGTSRHVMVMNNVIHNPGTSVATIQNDIDDAHWNVSNNEISFLTAAGPGINMGGTGNIVCGNTVYYDSSISASNGDAIRLACDETLCSGNNVIGNGKANRGYVITASHTGVSLLGNRTSGTTVDAILCSSVSTTNVIDGNVVQSITSGGGINFNGASGTNWHGWVGRMVSTGPLQLSGNIGFFTTTPIAKRTGTPADATDLASAITLVNALKAHLVTYGLVS